MQNAEAIDRARQHAGFLTVAETVDLMRGGVAVLDPYSTLISRSVDIAPSVTLWPGVTLQVGVEGKIAIAAGAELHSGTRIVALRGRVIIGESAEIGEEGGFTIKPEHADGVIEIGRMARLLGGGSAILNNMIGDGAQVLGPIRMQNCVLGSGDSHRGTDPDKRGAVLKGSGVARRIELAAGEVIQAFGVFSEAPVRRQSYFHPAVRQE